ncbi:S66 peptidase family protein [Bowmanella dokdonensis]|uniref:LD-carboxypeptidase n=1 Tax=Bowmanella dokdonensis TaxID=751969 RepID=A0A939DPJ9_9ALTE|nr:LD-carboxypeptidase [Bowmanella dokdonensis]MBN7826608.1 LD-carboxypeptidase [Bowmanella dokdonensis]
MDRRAFIKASAAGVLASQLSPVLAAGQGGNALPKRWQAGDKVMLVAPASAIFDPIEVEIARESFEAMGLEVVSGQHVLDRHGYLAGQDKDRAADINRAFADPAIQGLVALRGGWGCNRLLPYLDFKLIAANHKILLGYSDITSLLNSLYQHSGLVSFHGPVGMSYWGAFQAEQVQKLLFNGEQTLMQNYPEQEDALTMRSNRARTVNDGRASGVLVGGNLTVLASLVGTPYLPDMRGKILMLEDVGETIYRIDRYLSTLQLSGILSQLAGVVFGHCTECEPQKGYGGFTLMEVMEQYFKPLGVPCYVGAQFGHIKDNHILPVGGKVEVDATACTLKLLEPVVT